MVSGPAAGDAVARAQRLNGLRVGLHLVLVEGRPVLPPESLPDLVDSAGRFRLGLAELSLAIIARPSIRRQVASEIEGQFAAFRASGLRLDHVNAHKHFHLHPTVARAIIAIGRSFGLDALRVPIEPRSVLAIVEPRTPRGSIWVTAPWAARLARTARRAGLRTPDAVFGLAWSGAMTAPRLAGLLDHLPAGRTEIYLHPATRDDFPGHAAGYRYRDELVALTAPSSIAATRRADLKLGGYVDF